VLWKSFICTCMTQLQHSINVCCTQFAVFYLHMYVLCVFCIKLFVNILLFIVQHDLNKI
jgi:hypothetical protein